MTFAYLSSDTTRLLDTALITALDATNTWHTSSIAAAGLPESRQLSDQLRNAAHAAGLDTAVGRRFLQLRDDLDSHVLAASVLEESGGRNARRMLRRGVEAVAAHSPIAGS